MVEEYDGVRIRPARMSDAGDLHRVRIAPEAARDTLGLPSISFERFEQQMQKWLEKSGVHLLVAEVEGAAVGMIQLSAGSDRRAHCGSLGMAVHDDYHGRGIGSALLEAIVDLADSWLGLHRLQLEVYADNAVAIRMYERAGFQREGCMRRAAVRDGRLADIVLMGRLRD